MMTGEEFVAYVADRLAALPGVVAVALGGSRAQGTHRPGSDWDFALYYRSHFDPADLRGIGWAGEVSEIGAWGGVFNGGAWPTIDDRRVDVHYRDPDVVEYELAEAEHQLFHWEPLMFHLAGIPSYLPVAELAGNKVMRGILPRPAFPRSCVRPHHPYGVVGRRRPCGMPAARTFRAVGPPRWWGPGHSGDADGTRDTGRPRGMDHQRETAATPGEVARARHDRGRGGYATCDPGACGVAAEQPFRAADPAGAFDGPGIE